MLETRRFPAIGWLFPLLLGPALLVDCSSAGPLSLGDANAGASSSGASSAGSANAGPGNAGSNSAGSIGAAGESGGSNATCPTADCGSALGLLNYECEDGSMGGPTGRCLRRANGSCGWEVLRCTPASGDSGGSGGAGSGSAGASGDGGAATCPALLADVQSALAAAQSCNTASARPEPECAGTLEGLCCPVLVEASATSNSAANTAYLNALHAYQQSCSHVCPKIACFDPQPGDCVAAPGATLGTCGGGTGF